MSSLSWNFFWKIIIHIGAVHKLRHHLRGGNGGLDTPKKWWRHFWTAPNQRSSDSKSPFLFQRPQERVSERARCGRYIEVALPGDDSDGKGGDGGDGEDGDDGGDGGNDSDEGGCDNDGDVGDDGGDNDHDDSGGDYLLEPKAFEDPLDKPAHPMDWNQLKRR